MLFIPIITNVSYHLSLVLPVGIIFLILLLRDLKYGLYIFAFSYPLVSFIKRGLIVPGLALNEVLLVSIGVIFLINLSIGKYPIRRNGLFIPFIIYFFAAGVFPLVFSILSNQNINLKIILQFFASAQYYLILILFHNVFSDNDDKKTLLLWILVGGVVVSIIGILQFFNLFNIDLLISRFFTVHWRDVADIEVSRFGKYNRVTSTLNNWNGCGAYLVCTISVAILLFRFGKSIFYKLFIIGAGILCGISLLLTFSLTSYLMLVLLLFFLCIFLRRYRLILYFLFISIVLIVVFASFFEPQLERQFGYGGWIPHSLIVRFRIWKEYMIPEILENLFFGIGAQYYNMPHTAESFYFLLLLRGGLLFLGAFLFLFFKMVYEVIKSIKITDDYFNKYLQKLVLALLFAVFIGNFTEPYFRFAGVAELIWILLAFSYPIDEKKKVLYET